MKKDKAQQMAREIAGFMAENKADFYEVLSDYCEGMKSRDVDHVEDTYFEMRNSGKLKDITGVQ